MTEAHVGRRPAQGEQDLGQGRWQQAGPVRETRRGGGEGQVEIDEVVGAEGGGAAGGGEDGVAVGEAHFLQGDAATVGGERVQFEGGERDGVHQRADGAQPAGTGGEAHAGPGQPRLGREVGVEGEGERKIECGERRGIRGGPVRGGIYLGQL